VTPPDEDATPGDRPDEAEGPADGYAWDFERQERDLPPEEYRAHLAILDDLEDEELAELDLSRAGDYVLWAAAQALDEIGRRDRAIEALHRLDASTTAHPALDYPLIRLRLAELLKERGDYAEALEVLDRVERQDADLSDACREQRAEILVLSGREAEGLRLFEKAARRARGDPRVPLAAAWALMQRGRYEEATAWIDRAEKEMTRSPDDEAAARARSEIDRLRAETRARAARREAPAPPAGEEPGHGEPPTGARLADLRREILAALDREEVRLVEHPPRDEPSRAGAADRLADLSRRTAEAWGDAIEAADEPMIAAFDDLQDEITGVAERFGIELPDPDED
jgi:tetratricopeptide (TPR) repeat protein